MPEITPKGRQRLDLIIASADNMIRQYGYEDMTLRLLAQELGISRGHLGHYFKEKKDLLFVLTDVTLKNLWTASESLCMAWHDPYATYAFAVHWFFLICVHINDIKRVIFQSLKHWDIQREFSRRFAQCFIDLLKRSQADFDEQNILTSIQVSFAAHFNYVYNNEAAFTEEISIEGSNVHLEILFLLQKLSSQKAKQTNDLALGMIQTLSVERLVKPFTYTYSWYEIENNPFVV